MTRPLVRFVECDGCGTRVEHTETIGKGSGWIPPRWAEIFDRTSGTSDDTRHVCGPCKAELMETLEKIRSRRVTMISPEEHSAIMSARKPKLQAQDDMVLVHADGGACHGMKIEQGHCVGCGYAPDMQSTELWPAKNVIR